MKDEVIDYNPSFFLIFMLPFIHEKPSVNGTDIGYSMYPQQLFVSDGLSYLLTMAGS